MSEQNPVESKATEDTKPSNVPLKEDELEQVNGGGASPDLFPAITTGKHLPEGSL
jgi:hypothetical protein